MNQVDAYIANREAPVAATLSALRELILRCSPAISESIKYGLPFFTYHRPLCYLNPTRSGINLGFTRGAELSNGKGVLAGKGKLVRHIHIPCGDTIPERLIRETLYESMMLNDPAEGRK